MFNIENSSKPTFRTVIHDGDGNPIIMGVHPVIESAERQAKEIRHDLGIPVDIEQIEITIKWNFVKKI